jgi:hypothetical protein
VSDGRRGAGRKRFPIPGQAQAAGMSEPAAPAPRAFTGRAIALGLALAGLFAALAPLNDWQLKNTFLYSQQLPTGVLLLVVLAGLAVNPALGRWRLRGGELLVITALLLVVGGVASSGLTRLLYGVIAGPAKVMTVSRELDALAPADGPAQLPRGLFVGVPERGRPDPSDPEYRRVIDGFHIGASGADHSVPWRPWALALLHWAPLLLGLSVCFLALAGLVRRQWMDHERLPYPIAHVLGAYLEEPGPGRRLAALYRERGFWVGFAVVALVLLSQGLSAYKLWPLPVATEISLWGQFNTTPYNQMWTFWGMLTLRIYFSIVAMTFFLPTDLSFSLWFFHVFTNVAVAALRLHGVPVTMEEPSIATMGGYAVQILLILWVGRGFYGRVLRAALAPGGDPALRIEAWYARALMLGIVGLVAAMTASGARADQALVAVLVYLGISLVLTRLVAEAGIPFVNTPTWWGATSVIYSLTGVALTPTAIVPIALLGATMVSDSRENLLQYAANADHLAAKAQARRLPASLLMLLVVAGAIVISGMVMLMCAYRGNGMTFLDGDGNWRKELLKITGPGATGLEGGAQPLPAHLWLAYGVGALATAGLGVARLAWSWWPLHPLGYLASATYAAYMTWFSILLGWLCKLLVLRYGGMRAYTLLKPVAYGMIAGEAVLVGGFLLVGLVAGLCGWHLPGQPRFLPG